MRGGKGGQLFRALLNIIKTVVQITTGMRGYSVKRKRTPTHHMEHVCTRMLTHAHAMYVGTHARMHVDTHVCARLTFCIYFNLRSPRFSCMHARPLAGSLSWMRPLPTLLRLYLSLAARGIGRWLGKILQAPPVQGKFVHRALLAVIGNSHLEPHRVFILEAPISARV